MNPRFFLLCKDQEGCGVFSPISIRKIHVSRFVLIKLSVRQRVGDEISGLRVFDRNIYRRVVGEADLQEDGGDNPVEESIQLSLLEGLHLHLRRHGFYGIKLLDAAQDREEEEAGKRIFRPEGERLRYEIDPEGITQLAYFLFYRGRPAAALALLSRIGMSLSLRDGKAKEHVWELKMELRRAAGKLVEELFPFIGKAAKRPQDVPVQELLLIPVVYGFSFFESKAAAVRKSEHLDKAFEEYEKLRRLKNALPTIRYEEVLDVVE